MLKLFTFHASGSAYRIRIALALKGLDYEPVYVVGGRGSTDLTRPEYLALNPSGVIPTLVDGDRVLTQSLAIMEYLDEAYPARPLLPADPMARAHVRAMAQVVLTDTHPLSTARVIDYLDAGLGLSPDQVGAWNRHWNGRGLAVVERMLAADPGRGDYCHGGRPGLADIALISQVFVARKFNLDFSGLPLVSAVAEACMILPAFRDTAPERQPDAPGNAPKMSA